MRTLPALLFNELSTRRTLRTQSPRVIGQAGAVVCPRDGVGFTCSRYRGDDAATFRPMRSPAMAELMSNIHHNRSGEVLAQ